MESNGSIDLELYELTYVIIASHGWENEVHAYVAAPNIESAREYAQKYCSKKQEDRICKDKVFVVDLKPVGHLRVDSKEVLEQLVSGVKNIPVEKTEDGKVHKMLTRNFDPIIFGK